MQLEGKNEQRRAGQHLLAVYADLDTAGFADPFHAPDRPEHGGPSGPAAWTSVRRKVRPGLFRRLSEECCAIGESQRKREQVLPSLLARAWRCLLSRCRAISRGQALCLIAVSKKTE